MNDILETELKLQHDFLVEQIKEELDNASTINDERIVEKNFVL